MVVNLRNDSGKSTHCSVRVAGTDVILVYKMAWCRGRWPRLGADHVVCVYVLDLEPSDADCQASHGHRYLWSKAHVRNPHPILVLGDYS